MIKLNIDIPESCLDCPLHDGEYGRCNLDGNIELHWDDRPRLCPIIECKEGVKWTSRYCPNCGADMRGDRG